MKKFDSLLQGLKKRPELWHYSLLSLLLFLILFVKLGSFHMRMWDESMFAVNTYEMIENGNYFSLFYNGEPDLYNTKPPLTNWLQIVSVKLFGYNELAIRLPSATAAFFTVILLFRFVARYFNYIWAWITALILISSAGFVGYHTARTGEADALLTFFLLTLNLNFIQFLIHQKKSTVFWSFLILLLAFSTKLYAAFLFIPAYLFLLIYYKKFKAFVLNPYFFAGLGVFLSAGFILLYLRELQSPGYLEIIWLNDAGRLFSIPAEFEKPLFYYIENFYQKRFDIFFIPLILGCILIFFKPQNEPRQKILLSGFCLVLAYLLIISLSVTKLPWYDMPLYPLLSLISGYSLVEFIHYLTTQKTTYKPYFSYIIVALLLVYPYYFRFSKSQGNKIDDGAIEKEANERYIHQAMLKNTNLDGLKVLYRSYNGGLLFYKYKLREAQQEITLHSHTTEFKVGDKVLVCKDEHRDSLRKTFTIEPIDHYQYADVYRLKPLRQNYSGW